MKQRHSPYKKSQSLSRGLAILHAISQTNSGTASISELQQRTGVHRTTIRRLLQTLIDEGYVKKIHANNRYQLSHRIRELNDGYTDDEWITEIATPAIGKLLYKTLWPSDLCTLDGSAVIIRETTHRFSSLSFHRAMVRKRLPLLTTAAGRAYFCYCSAKEREQLLTIIRAESSEQSKLAKSPQFITQLIEKTVAQGYASNNGDWHKEDKTAAIALPVRYKDKIISTINIVFLKKILTPQQASAQFLPALKQCVSHIEAELEATQPTIRP